MKYLRLLEGEAQEPTINWLELDIRKSEEKNAKKDTKEKRRERKKTQKKKDVKRKKGEMMAFFPSQK